MHNFNLAIVDCIYMFQVKSTHHQVVYKKYKKEIILHIDNGMDEIWALQRLILTWVHISITYRKAFSNMLNQYSIRLKWYDQTIII